MSDIVERLRAAAPKGMLAAHASDLPALHEAADEIERLRAILKKTRDYLQDIGDYPEPGEIIAEIEAVIPHGQGRRDP